MAMRINVGIADLKVTGDSNATLITLALGSCIGVAIYDPLVKVGGMIHYMLPKPLSPGQHESAPYKFCTTGIPILFKSCYELGAHKSRLVVKVAGGAEVMQANRSFSIGRKNHEALTELLSANKVQIDAADVGGCVPRTLTLNLADGEVGVRYPGGRYRVL